MTHDFVEGTPERLETHLRYYDPKGKSNVSVEELRSSVVGYIPNESEGSEKVYFFFQRGACSIETKIGDQERIYIALSADRYRFREDQNVGLSPQRLDIKLSTRARSVYENILQAKSMNLNELLEAVGFIINDSMEFDFELMKFHTRMGGGDPSKWNPIKVKYRASGNEVMKGVCIDAGAYIRRLLGSLNLDERYKFTYVRSENSFSPHDTTVVFDKQTGEWAVINSKSPTKPYNLTPKEKLSELGSPYVTESQAS